MYALVPGSSTIGLYEIRADGSASSVGATPRITFGASVGSGVFANGAISSPVQVAVYDGDASIGILVPAFSPTFTPVSGLFPVGDLATINGYFLALNSSGDNKIQISKLFDATLWNALDYSIWSTTGDFAKRIFAAHGQLWIFGYNSTSVWTPIDPGTTGDFPFVDYPPGALNLGLWAKYSIAFLDESIFMLTGDSRGVPMVVRINGYTPQRISDFALEQEISQYTSSVPGFRSDAIGYSRYEAGHLFYVLNFPGANKTKVYDLTTRKWHDEGYWNGSSFDPDASMGRYRGNCHCFSSLKTAGSVPTATPAHYLGDYANGNIYKSSISIYDDDGQSILYQRTSPHLNLSNLIERHVSLEVLVEQGIVSGPAPTMWLEISSDGGRTFGPPLSTALAANGGNANLTRAWWRRLGRARDRVYRLTRTDANRQAWIDGFIRTQPGNGS